MIKHLDMQRELVKKVTLDLINTRRQWCHARQQFTAAWFKQMDYETSRLLCRGQLKYGGKKYECGQWRLLQLFELNQRTSLSGTSLPAIKGETNKLHNELYKGKVFVPETGNRRREESFNSSINLSKRSQRNHQPFFAKNPQVVILTTPTPAEMADPVKLGFLMLVVKRREE